jgi:predicted Fe-Mo cluster-binding NifX family protein
MKIAIASDDEKTVSQHFGRTRGFVIYTVNGSQPVRLEYRANTLACHGEEAGHDANEGERHAQKANAFADCGVVIAGGMGPGMRQALKRAGIQSIVTDQETVEGVVNALMIGLLVDAANHECCHGKEDCGKGKYQ